MVLISKSLIPVFLWDTLYSTHCVYVLYSMHYILCIIFYELYSMNCIRALYSMHCVLKSVFFSLCSLHCILGIVFYTLYDMHCFLCIVFYTLWFMHCFLLCILCIVFYTMSSGDKPFHCTKFKKCFPCSQALTSINYGIVLPRSSKTSLVNTLTMPTTQRKLWKQIKQLYCNLQEVLDSLGGQMECF